MIAPINFLWKQLNGPQITAFCRAVYLWIKDLFDDKLDYFNTFSIDTANDEHLTTLGTLMGIKRPMIGVQNNEDFWFTNTKEKSTRGFGDIGSDVGGLFSSPDPTGMNASYIGEEYYRPLLKTVATGKGMPGSLVLIDEICAYFYDTYRQGEQKNYLLYHEPDNLDAEQGYMVGDILLFLGRIEDWGSTSFFIHSIMNVLNLYAYAPLPSLFHLFEEYEDNPVYFKFSEEKETSIHGWATSKEAGDGGVLS